MKEMAHAVPDELIKKIEDYRGRMLIDEFNVLLKKYFPYLSIPDETSQ
jgi:hypothetical protein